MRPIVGGMWGWGLLGLVGLGMALSACTSGGSADRQASSTTSSVITAATMPPTTSTTGGPMSTVTAKRTCRASDLEVTVQSGDGLGGTTYTPLVFTNRSSTPSGLMGYPKVSFLDRSGRVIGQAAQTPPEGIAVTVAPGEAAFARMGVASALCLGDGQPLYPATLRVVLPAGGTVSVAAGDFAF